MIDTVTMEMMLRTRVAIVTALIMLMHHLSLKVVAFSSANNTTLSNNNTVSTGFSLRLVANNAIRRHDDGFLHLQTNNLQPHPASNVTTTLRPETNTFDYLPLQNSLTVMASFGSGHGLRTYYLKVDRAVNSFTWIQCLPCVPQAEQLNELFNTALSPTFRHIPGTSLVCGRPFGTPRGNLCEFRHPRPSGGIQVTGYVEEDTFMSGPYTHPNYIFGCSHSTRNFNSEGRFAGEISVGRGQLSLVMQVAARGITQFSYCLVGGSETNRHGFLRFGSDIPQYSPHYRTTRILPALEANESEYYLSLTDISLGGQKLDGIRPEMFGRSKDRSGGGGCVIDLGTPLTVVVQEAYNIVQEAVWSDLQKSHQKVERVERPGFGLCFRATESVKGRFKSLSLHFSEEEAVLVLSPQQLFLMMPHDKEGQIACLAMKPGNRTVIGAFQQVDTRFVYDVKDSKLSFASESCTRDTVQVD